eukprot:TRINITY_DN3258_c0_g1_i2.p1 TRINITY_DN3258_c0_g1~~TRINITY_DN3258_c0_g1_i2.p1  ORF type:complete len:332 (+),score=54.58 TRINITY_DN3258_c0_g1_i2:80-1075(+)
MSTVVIIVSPPAVQEIPSSPPVYVHAAPVGVFVVQKKHFAHISEEDCEEIKHDPFDKLRDAGPTLSKIITALLDALDVTFVLGSFIFSVVNWILGGLHYPSYNIASTTFSALDLLMTLAILVSRFKFFGTKHWQIFLNFVPDLVKSLLIYPLLIFALFDFTNSQLYYFQGGLNIASFCISMCALIVLMKLTLTSVFGVVKGLYKIGALRTGYAVFVIWQLFAQIIIFWLMFVLLGYKLVKQGQDHENDFSASNDIWFQLFFIPAIVPFSLYLEYRFTQYWFLSACIELMDDSDRRNFYREAWRTLTRGLKRFLFQTKWYDYICVAIWFSFR